MLRGKAQSVSTLLGRSSVIFLGVIGLPATQWLNGNGIYVIFGGLSFLALICVYTLPQRTTI